MRSALSMAFQLAAEEQPRAEDAAAAHPQPQPPPPPPGSPTQARRRALQPPPVPLWQRVCRALGPAPHAYLQSLGPLAPTARPTALQPLALRRSGAHAPSALGGTRLAADGTQLAELPVDRAGQLLPVQAGLVQCHLELGTVKGVPPSGVKDRKVSHYAARACLYDGARFHGSVQTIRPRKVKAGQAGDTTWQWDAGLPLLVRCPLELLQHGVGLYVELNVAHEMEPEEVELLPAKHAAQQVTEVCLAYALLDLSTLPTLHAARTLSVPLRGGPLALRRTLQQCVAAAALAAPAHAPKAAPPKLAVNACLPFTLKPVPPGDTAAALLPRQALASAPLARVVSLYRQLLAAALGTLQGTASLAPAADPVLASFLAVLDDEDLSATFMQLWRQELLHSTATGVPPATAAELQAAFRRCATTVWAARGAQAVPLASCAKHTPQHRQRCTLLKQFAANPAASLGSGAHAWLHRPFDCRELRAGPLEELGATV